jgi:hypothetical protein
MHIVSEKARTAVADPNDNPASIITPNRQLFSGKLNKEAFQFGHNLVGSGLFDLSRLGRLAETVRKSNRPRSFVSCKVAESVPNISRQWANFTSSERVAESIKHIGESGSWIMIKGAEIDPDYNFLLQRILGEIENLCGVPMQKQITFAEATIFIASPNSVTHYHVDSEANFLFQIHGDKEVHLFDPTDRLILSEEAIESFYFDGANVPPFRDHYESKSKVFEFIPGSGLHIPVNAPHWVKNLDKYVVTLSVLFYLKSMDRRASVYQVNHLLRRFGLRPTSPGISASRDFWKSRLIEVFSLRSPKSQDEILRSGVKRLTRPLRLYERLRAPSLWKERPSS